MACTYDISVDGCFLIVTEQPSGDIIQQLNLSTIVYVEKSDDNFILTDGDNNIFQNDIDNVNGYATRALLFADIDTWRAACSLIPAGGFPPAPSYSTGTAAYFTDNGAASTTANLQAVSITNIGAAVGIVLGDDILPGQTVEFSAYFDNVAGTFVRVPAISYDASGTEFGIATFV